MAITYRISKFQRGFLFRDGSFVRTLGPGTHRIWERLWSPSRTRVDVVSTLDTRLCHENLDALLDDAALRAELVVVDLTDAKRAVVRRDGRVYALLTAGRYAYWRSPFTIEVDVFDVTDERFTSPELDAILSQPDAATFLEVAVIPESSTGLVFRNGKLVETLAPGRHVWWKSAGKLLVSSIDQREIAAEISGQEILTKDRVSLRLNLSVAYRVTDPVKAATATPDFSQAVYREAQLALRAAVGVRTLDGLLADKEAIATEVTSVIAARATEIGLSVRTCGLKDVILPGEMKAILNQVIQAEKEAEANLIRRREETAAARSQANTARLLAENPVLLKLKEMESLREVLAGAKTTFVFGSGGISEQIRSLIAGGDTS